MTSLERVYLIALLKKLERTEDFCTTFTSASLCKLANKRLNQDTAGESFTITHKEFLEIADVVGIRMRRVVKSSPQMFFNISVRSIMEHFSDVMF
jgi:hypothetical protein